MSEPSLVDLSDHVDRMADEAGGAISLVVIDPDSHAALVAAMLWGDPEATKILTAARDAKHRIKTAPKRRPMLCASCPAPLRWGRCSVVIALPYNKGATTALGMAICDKCATGAVDVATKASDGLRLIWPNARQIVVTHEGGRA